MPTSHQVTVYPLTPSHLYEPDQLCHVCSLSVCFSLNSPPPHHHLSNRCSAHGWCQNTFLFVLRLITRAHKAVIMLLTFQMISFTLYIIICSVCFSFQLRTHCHQATDSTHSSKKKKTLSDTLCLQVFPSHRPSGSLFSLFPRLSYFSCFTSRPLSFSSPSIPPSCLWNSFN